jgi:hypothetical protein
MQKPLIFALVGVAALGVGVWVLLGPTDPPPSSITPPPPPPPEITRTPTSATLIRSAIPCPQPPPPTEAKAVEPPPPLAPLPEEIDPLREITFREATDADRQRLNVPKRFGHGVVLGRVGPDSPAAISALQEDDVIVRAHRTDVNTADDLRRAVHDREHTLLVVARNGQYFEVVLHRPEPH